MISPVFLFPAVYQAYAVVVAMAPATRHAAAVCPHGLTVLNRDVNNFARPFRCPYQVRRYFSGHNKLLSMPA